jgi:hypothetical protein
MAFTSLGFFRTLGPAVAPSILVMLARLEQLTTAILSMAAVLK